MKPLASGGMAELLLARTAPTERPLVLKWIRPEQAIDGTFIEAFVSEGRRAAQLHHPNIVEVHEVGREDGTHYLAMEYVHGDDLRKLLARLHERRAKLPVQHVLAISTAVAQALHHAHEQRDPDGQPVLHLGIKPANVIITADGAVKLADFGINRAALTEGRTDLIAQIAGYLSPEQCTGQPVDRRSDVFGLGVLMYELAVGRRLFKGDNEFVTMAAIVAGDIPPPTKLRGDLPKELEGLILKALARAPEDRFQTAGELHTALEKFATKAGVRGSLTTLSGYTKRLFGVRPEPWLVDEEPSDAAMTDFDNSPKGVAIPPAEASRGCALPSFVAAADDSPIMRVKKQVSRDLPTEQLNLAALKAASTPVKIPSAPNGQGARAVPKPLPNRPTPVPARGKPKTVQIPVTKEESTKVMVPPPSTIQDEPTHEKTNVLSAADISEVTKESRQMPAIKDDRAPTTPIAAKKKDNDFEVDTSVEPPLPAPPRAPLPPPPRTNGKPALVSLLGPQDADAQRELAKRRAAADAARLPNPAVAGELVPRPQTPMERGVSNTDVDLITVESTAVANPPPMVAAATVARDATEHVKPLPKPGESSITTTDNIVVPPRRTKWLVLGAVALLGVAAAAYVFVFKAGGDDEAAAPEPSAAVVAKDEPKQDEPKPEETKPEELRTTDVPRTPRNSHVTTDDPKPEEPKPEEPKPEEPKTEEPKPEEQIAAVPPPPPEPEPVKVEEPKPKQVEEPKPVKFEEPRDPAPPDEEKPVKKPAPKKTVVAQKAKPKPKPVAAKPKPVATKPKPKPAKPAGKWDPNALFPTKK